MSILTAVQPTVLSQAAANLSAFDLAGLNGQAGTHWNEAGLGFVLSDVYRSGIFGPEDLYRKASELVESVRNGDVAGAQQLRQNLAAELAKGATKQEQQLRSEIGGRFSKVNTESDLEELREAFEKSGLGIEKDRPGRGAMLRSVLTSPKTIREGIYRRLIEASFDSDPQAEKLTIAGMEGQARKTMEAIQNFFKLEHATGKKEKAQRILLKRQILIAFRNVPWKFEFENQPNPETVPAKARKHFDEEIQKVRQKFALNRRLLEEVAAEYGVEEDGQRIQQSPFNRFLRGYHLTDLQHPYWTGVATAASAYVGGSVLAKLIVGAESPITWSQVGVLGALSLYYGWENRVSLEALQTDIPVHRHKHIGNMRAGAYMFGVSPSWTVRHTAFLALVHGRPDSALGIIGSGLATWATTLPPVFLIETFIQGKIPLRYRFLSQASVITAWHTVASLFALLG